MPTHFWDDFHPDLIKENLNDQGPWGGHRATHWSTSQAGTFSPATLLQFAAQYDWIFMDSARFSDMVGDRTLFPLGHSGLDTSTNINSTHEYFPIWIKAPATLYRFKTNWVTVEPGTDESHTALGYVVINSARQEMAVYHLWGE